MTDVGVEEQIALIAPTGQDISNLASVLRMGGLHPAPCRTLGELAESVDRGCGAVALTEEALDPRQLPLLLGALDRQPTWSDLPILLITGGRGDEARATVGLLSERANVSLIERPLRRVTIVAAVKSAMRARRRQYEVRDLIAERAVLLGSLEERVKQRTAELRLMIEELESFSYSISHDLRTPLRAVVVYGEVLLQEYGPRLEAEARDYVERMARASRRMDRLTQDLLTYTRASRANITLEPIDLDEQVGEIVESYHSLKAWQNHISVRRPLGVVLAHPPSLTQCLANLLENAVKFTRPGQEPKIEIYSDRVGDDLRITIQDHGIGIEAPYFEKIFQMFERLDQSGPTGTGIGLAIVKKAAQRMGGSVGVNSTFGQGSAFWLRLARAPAAQPAVPS
jgi:signal transduction histidine kinase